MLMRRFFTPSVTLLALTFYAATEFACHLLSCVSSFPSPRQSDLNTILPVSVTCPCELVCRMTTAPFIRRSRRQRFASPRADKSCDQACRRVISCSTRWKVARSAGKTPSTSPSMRLLTLARDVRFLQRRLPVQCGADAIPFLLEIGAHGLQENRFVVNDEYFESHRSCLFYHRASCLTGVG